MTKTRLKDNWGGLLIVVLLAVALLAGAFLLWPNAFDYSAGRPAVNDPTQPATTTPPVPLPRVVTHLLTPKPVRAIYMTSYVAGTPSLREKLVKVADTTEVNALVIDIKDYTGRIAFAVTDPLLKKWGAEEIRIADLPEFIDRLHAKNVYLIARIATFQDPFIAKEHPNLAVKRASDGAVWRDRKGIRWVDPGATEYWDYTASLAREAYKIGFDEVQLDYIRYPSDGDMNDIAYPFSKFTKTHTKADVLADFFAYFKTKLSDIPLVLSVDLFGMTTTNTDDLGIGQVLEKAAPYFDYISPMVYPSHYPPTFHGYPDPNSEPYGVIKFSMTEAARRLTAASSTPDKLRPWLQDFSLYGVTYTAAMIRQEKKAVYDSGLDSWLLWSPSNNYTLGALDKEATTTTAKSD